MIRLVALAFALAVLTTSAEAMPLPKLDVPDGLVTQVAQACGVGFRRVGGVCVRRATVRQARRVVRRDVRQTRRAVRRY